MVEEAQTLGTAKFLLKYRSKYGEAASWAATQAELGPAAENKLPSFHAQQCFYTRRALEQCTSESVAQYKAGLFSGQNLLAIAGGLGVDDWAFSFTFDKVVSLDPDPELNAIAQTNALKMGRNNISRITSTAEDYLSENKESFDMIYSDPDRRKDDKRQILLSQHQPDIITLMPELRVISRHLLVKCSPMYDHEMANREIENLKDIYILSYRGEVKEMLLHADFNHEGTYRIHCAEVNTSEQVSFSQNETGSPVLASKLEGYFYEVSAGISKVRKHHVYAAKMQLELIDQAVPFYHSSRLLEDFMGRRFRIIDSMLFKTSDCLNYLKANSINKANIKARGLQFSTADVYKKLKLGEGGDDYLFVFPFRGETCMIHSRY